MAELWKKRINGTLYEVRGAGASRRLYENGVFHSQYNPRNPVTGGVWDLLMLPAFFYPPDTIKRVLVLGVGGGAVIRQLQYFIGPEHLIGVDLNAVHLALAKRFFGIRGRNISLHEDNALHWLRRYRGKGFDLIIDDVFAEQEGEPVRAINANAVWAGLLLRNLNAGGALAVNFISPRELRDSAFVSNQRVRNRLKTCLQLTAPLDENAVGVFMRKHCKPGDLRRRLSGVRFLDPALKSNKLRYRARSV